jgi:hypothetical protein
MTDGEHKDGCPASAAPVITDKRRMATPEQQEETATKVATAENEERSRLKAYILDNEVPTGMFPEGALAFDDYDDMSTEMLRQTVMTHQASADDSVTASDLAGDEDRKQVLTAFLVIIDYDGAAQAIADISTPLEMERLPTFTDFFAGASQVIKDITEMETAERVVGAMMRHSQEQMMQAAIRRQQEMQGQAETASANRATRRKK